MFNSPHHNNAHKHPSWNKRVNGTIVMQSISAVCGYPAAERSLLLVFHDASLESIRGFTFDGVIVCEPVSQEVMEACSCAVATRKGFVYVCK